MEDFFYGMMYLLSVGALFLCPTFLLIIRGYASECRRLREQLDEANRVRREAEVRCAELSGELAIFEKQLTSKQ